MGKFSVLSKGRSTTGRAQREETESEKDGREEICGFWIGPHATAVCGHTDKIR